MNTANDPQVLLINPPMLQKEVDYGTEGTPGKFHIKAINPGLISIASYLSRHGVEVRIIDLLGGQKIEDIEQALKSFTKCVIGISSTSAYDYLESLDIAKEIKSKRADGTNFNIK